MNQRILPKTVCDIAGISYRQLQYWDSNGYAMAQRNKRNQRFYFLNDLMVCVALANLRRMGYSIQQITKDMLPWVKVQVYGLEKSEELPWDAMEFGPGSRLVIGPKDTLLGVEGHFASPAEWKCFLEFDEVLAKVSDPDEEQEEDENPFEATVVPLSGSDDENLGESQV